MKKKLYILIFTMTTMVLFSACREDEPATIPEIRLPALPANSIAYFTLDLNDSTYNFQQGADGITFSTSYVFPVDPNENSSMNASVRNDTSLIEFEVGYNFYADNRNQLLQELVRPEGKVAYYTYENTSRNVIEDGFYFTIIENESQEGPGFGVSSSNAIQPDTSFFRILNYYAGESEHTIWLEGQFNLTINRGLYSHATGLFKLEFPVCCFD